MRNQYVHSAIDKPKAKDTLAGWKHKCDQMIDQDCMKVLRHFWRACYPGVQFPIVIANTFDGDSFKGRAGKFYAEPN